MDSVKLMNHFPSINKKIQRNQQKHLMGIYSMVNGSHKFYTTSARTVREEKENRQQCGGGRIFSEVGRTLKHKKMERQW